MKWYFFIALFILINFKIRSQSYDVGTKVIYLGSSAAVRHLDKNITNSQTNDYYKTPIIAIGFDYCFSRIRDVSNSRLGIGPYFSTWSAKRIYTDDKNNQWEKSWSDFAFGARFTHHLTYFIREKLDVCSGVIIGARYRHYHFIEKEQAGLPVNYRDKQWLPMAGITATIKYYFYKDMGLFAEGALGYKTDSFLFGLCYKIN